MNTHTAEVVTEQSLQVPAAPQQQAMASHTPSALLAIAVQQGADLAKLEKLMDLQERWEKNEARKAWVAAMSAFKAKPLDIFKDKHVSFTTAKGRTEYDHATIGNVVASITNGLAAHGLSHRWDTQQLDGGRIRVTCVLTHVMGHSESTVLEASPDDTGGKNNIQAIGSTVTYLQRYTLLAATGLATKDKENDDDGEAGGEGKAADISRSLGGTKEPEPVITEHQLADLRAKLEEYKVEEEAFCRFCRVDKLANLPARKFDGAVQELTKRHQSAPPATGGAQ